MRWTAPEALESRKFNDKTDVWSLGVTLYELWTQAALPYGSSMNNQKVWVEVAHGLRLPQPDECSDDVYSLMQQCWTTAQAERPTAAVAADRLRALYSDVTGMMPPAPLWHVEAGKGGASRTGRAGSGISRLAKDSAGYLMPGDAKTGAIGGRPTRVEKSKANVNGRGDSITLTMTGSSDDASQTSLDDTDAQGYLLSRHSAADGTAVLPGFYLDSIPPDFCEAAELGEATVSGSGDAQNSEGRKVASKQGFHDKANRWAPRERRGKTAAAGKEERTLDMMTTTGHLMMMQNPVFRAEDGAIHAYELASTDANADDFRGKSEA